MRWARISLGVPEEVAETGSYLLLELGCRGVEIIGERRIVRLIAYLPADATLQRRLHQLKQRADAAAAEFGFHRGVDLSLSFIEDEDWASAWRAYFQPLRIGRKIVIAPTWTEVPTKPGDAVVRLDPGMAFGTGTHQTTQLCLEALEVAIGGGETVFDVGCGSGILSIAAIKLGAARALAIDCDPLAVEATRENAELNGIAQRVEVRLGNLLEGVAGRAEIVVANLTGHAVAELAPDVPGHLSPGGLFISSGITEHSAARVEEVIGRAGLEIKHIWARDEWRCIIARGR